MPQLNKYEAQSLMQSLGDALRNLAHAECDPARIESARRNIIHAWLVLFNSETPEHGLTPIIDIIAPIVARAIELKETP